jgi:hypothetical protein
VFNQEALAKDVVDIEINTNSPSNKARNLACNISKYILES